MSDEQYPVTSPQSDAGTPPPYNGEVQEFDEEIKRNKDRFDYVVEYMVSKDEEILAVQRGILIESVGGPRNAESIDVWEKARVQLADNSYKQVDLLIDEAVDDLSKPAEQKDIFDKILEKVAADRRGPANPHGNVSRGPDVVDFSVGDELEALLDGDTLENPATLAKASRTIRLLANHGLYKFHKWGNGAQLQTALNLIEQYTINNPAFNPEDAGYDELKATLIMSQASLQVDQQSKPNYQYAKPERGYLNGQLAKGLAKLRNTEAEMFIGFNPDFEIPPVDNSDA